MLYNCVNIPEHEFLLIYNVLACKPRGLVLGEGIPNLKTRIVV